MVTNSQGPYQASSKSSRICSYYILVRQFVVCLFVCWCRQHWYCGLSNFIHLNPYNIGLITTGRNTLNGTIPDMIDSIRDTADSQVNADCTSFPNPLVRLGLNRLFKTNSSDNEIFANLKTLSLRECDVDVYDLDYVVIQVWPSALTLVWYML